MTLLSVWGKISLTIKMPLKDCEQGYFLLFYFQFGVQTIKFAMNGKCDHKRIYI